jgi:hypothetical protein
MNLTEHTNLEDRMRFLWAYRLALAAQRLRTSLKVKPRVVVRPRYTGVLPRQVDMDHLTELQWRAAVERNFERQRGLRLLQGEAKGQRGGT